MGKMLFLIENLQYNGLARQMTFLAQGVARSGHEVRVGVLGRAGPPSKELDEAGVPVEALGWTRWLSLGAVRRLRHLADSFSPDLLHTWGLPGLRAACLVANRKPLRVIASRPLPPGETRLSLPDRWLLRGADQVAAGGEAEARCLLALGVDPARLTAVPPAVEASRAVAGEMPLLSVRPFILCVGPFHSWKGYSDALWAFDILHFLRPDLHLVLAGEGPEKPRLERMMRGLESRRNIHSLGACADVPALMRRAELVWVPSRTAGGMQVALEAMAAGTAVVATRVPELAELLAPLGEEMLVPPGDKPALVRQTRRLLENAGRRRQMGDWGRRLVENSFTPEQLVRRYEGLYHKRAG